jgi:hypothetical protein
MIAPTVYHTLRLSMIAKYMFSAFMPLMPNERKASSMALSISTIFSIDGMSGFALFVMLYE